MKTNTIKLGTGSPPYRKVDMESQKFLAFWGLSHLPWNEPVAIDRLFWQNQTQALCSRLVLSLQKAGRFSIVVAPPGHGKSTLARWLYHSIDPKEHDVALFSLLQQQQGPGWLLDKLSHYLGIDASEKNPQKTLLKLQETYSNGRVLTILVDNAHHLAEPEAFDEVLSLAQVQAITSCRVNFVLIGNPKLLGTLQRMPEAQHRIAFVAEIPPFTRTELQSYISQRMQELNISRRMMAPEALAIFAQQGILTFAGADSLLEACLFEAFIRERKMIDSDIVMFALEACGVKRQKEDGDAGKAGKLAQQKRRISPSAGAQKTVSSQQQASGSGLNSLFYKSNGSQDSED